MREASCRAGLFGKHPERELRWRSRLGGQGSIHWKLQDLCLSSCSRQGGSGMAVNMNAEKACQAKSKAGTLGPPHTTADVDLPCTLLTSPEFRLQACEITLHCLREQQAKEGLHTCSSSCFCKFL